MGRPSGRPFFVRLTILLHEFEAIEYTHFMATISMFYGILIRMYLGKKDHNPPHIHALYQNKKALFDIKTGEKTDGNLPKDKEKLVSAWIILHKDELLADWELAQNGELPYNIEPLK
jgi:GH15 family glucan-1,4-alpha-glucosidase